MLRTPAPLFGALGAMEALVDPLSPRDRAFRAIGRNVTNFQRLESALKILLSLEATSGPLSQISVRMAARAEKRKRVTLGEALGEWLELGKPKNSSPPITPDLFEPWVDITFGLKIGSEYFLTNANELESLATARNHLVHHQLMMINFESAADCDELVGILDIQNERINMQVAHLAPAVCEIVEFGKWVEQPGVVDQLTEEFIRAIRSV